MRSSTHLKSVHFSTAYIIVHSPSKDVHGIMDNSCCMEQPPTWHLRETGQNLYLQRTNTPQAKRQTLFPNYRGTQLTHQNEC